MNHDLEARVVREASELGWRPGEAPRDLRIDGVHLVLWHTDRRGNEVMGWRYIDVMDLSDEPRTALLVIND